MTELGSDLRRVASSSSAYLLAALAQKGVAFILLPIYTRRIPTQGYGTLELLSAFSSAVFMVLLFGLPAAVNKCFHRDCRTEERKKQLLPTALILSLPILFIGTIPFWYQASRISLYLLGTEADALLVRLAILGGLAFSTNTLLLAGLRAEERAAAYGVLAVVQFTSTMAFNIYFVVVMGMEAEGVLWGNLLGTCIVLPLSLILATQGALFQLNRSLVGPLLVFGVLVLPAAASGWIIDLSDRYLLTRLAGLDEVAVYGVGYKVGMLLQLLVVWPFQLAWPAVSFSISEREDYKQTYAAMLTYLWLILAYAIVGVSIAARVFLPHIVGPGYGSAYLVVPLIALAYGLNGVHYCVSPGIHVANKTRTLAALTAMAAVANIGLNLLLIPDYGMMGAAFSTVLAFGLLAVGAIAVGQRYNPVPYEYGRILKVTVVSASVLGFSWISNADLRMWSVLWQLFLATAGVPLALFSVRFLTRDEYQTLSAFLRRARTQLRSIMRVR